MHLLERGGHDIVFISEANQNEIAGVRRALYQNVTTKLDAFHPAAHDLERGVRRAELDGARAR